MTKKDYELNLDAVCEKLETVCRKVWDEDRVSAVQLQAVSNEIISGLRRAEEIIASLRQELQTQESVIKRDYDARITVMEDQLDGAKARSASLEEDLRKAKMKIETLMKDLEKKEEENALFQERYLKLEAQKDSERAAHMEKFIEEEEAKEREREAFWKQRHLALEGDLKKHEAEFEQKRHGLLQEMQRAAEETRKLHLQKEADLMEAQRLLQAEFQSREVSLRERERDYSRKYEELEKLKQNLRAEIAELTRQYPLKTRDTTENK